MSRSARWQHVPVGTLALEAVALALMFVGTGRGVWQPHHTLGLAIVLPSTVLWTLARVQLGDAFTTRPEARRLVTHGLYARIPHPIYLFAECVSVGMWVFMGLPWMALLTAVVVVPVQVWRARREARVLEAAFGEEYRAYRRRTWW